MGKRTKRQGDEGTTVWVSKATRARLHAMARQLVAAADAGYVSGIPVAAETINPKALGLSMDQVITLLLDARDDHQARAKLSAANRREANAKRKGE